MTVIKPDEAAKDNAKIVNWLKDNKIENLAVHLDLDALNPEKFFSQLTNDPYSRDKYPAVTGKLDLRQITRLLKDVAANTNIVAFTIAEFMPWDAPHLKQMMQRLEIMR